jgi:hypothetical protein
VPILVGSLIGLVILAAALVAPHLRSSSAKAGEDASRQAALAQRLLSHYDSQLPHLGPLTGSAGAENPKFTALLHENDALLERAAQEAQQARSGEGATVLGVPQVAGMADYVRASGLFAESQALRQEQRLLQSRLLRLTTQWATYRANQDYLAGLDVREILSQLRTDLEEMRGLGTEAQENVSVLSAEVAQREQDLAGVVATRESLQEELRTLEQQSFTPGDDASFTAFRDRFVDLSAQLRDLEAEEQLLSLGGLRNAQWTEDDPSAGEVTGEPVVSLEALKGRLATAEERARRLTAAATALEDHIRFVEQAGTSAKQGESEYAELQDKLKASQEELLKPLADLAVAAAKTEDAALQAARRSVDAFRAAQQAADAWQSSAREVQSERDTERLNERLKMMTGDTTIPLVGNSGQAAALLLTGRIHAQRIEANEALIADMRQITEMRPGTSFDPAAYEEQVAVARENAIKVLGDARTIYEKLITKAPVNIKWIAQTGLAVTCQLQARVNPAEADILLADAVQTINEATDGREQSPYLRVPVLLRDHLREITGYTPPAESTDETPPAEETPDAEG